ncbi:MULTISPECIES: FMN-binding negative transcriptional regulator [unclassified Brevibacillus]|uniref:FMN-binding negative transcriptional regulator n=1 Tax=unclassified Brevibacillus TaxID=2684853 RepID=UPI00156AC52F|nr:MULTISPECIES: FMN-binding negative transcriptional regulator [unclassified Brevibacillus]NRQ52343.1 FMN-binding negative transcriptional regulator [Brevibacillus sp. HD1.4A]UED71543.1 FMN-binding negative transcriptional regulator [Brevibacillus sp. HD3.3A]
MFIPPSYRENDIETLVAFMKKYHFATIVSFDGTIPLATHLPFLVEHEHEQAKITLVSHMALANPQWRTFAEQDVLVMFQGPHAYISPQYYESRYGVPTWNYAAVHVYGKPVIYSQAEDVAQTLLQTIRTFEPAYEKHFDAIPQDYTEKLKQELVAFEIQVTKIEGAFKLSQDKPLPIRQRVADALAQSPDTVVAELGNMMQRQLPRAESGEEQ